MCQTIFFIRSSIREKGKKSISADVFVIEAQKLAFQGIFRRGTRICSQIFNINNIWPPAMTSYYLIWAYGGKKGKKSISGDVFGLKTQKFAFRLILGWGIQI